MQIQSISVSGNNFSNGQKTAVLVTLLVIALVLGIYYETVESIIAIWNRSDTYAHGYLIVPFSIYMIWKKRVQLATVNYFPDYTSLLILTGLGFGWLAASAASVLVVEQYALVAMIPVIVWAMLGRTAFITIIFPLAYLLFAVPFGESFIPSLINFTADFTVRALQMTGIPVYREGSYFSIPSGNWSVVEACSGVRYLIASVTLGTLYAYLTYRSISRRLMFFAFSILVPIIANGMRAYLIVMTGHLSDMTLAVGADHLIYGWVFFGLVMLLLFWIGSFWREDHLDETVSIEDSSPTANLKSSAVPVKSMLGMAGSIVLVVLAWPAYLDYLNDRTDTRPILEIKVTDPSEKWNVGPVQLADWTPVYTGAPRQFIGHFYHGKKHVSLYVTYYRNQKQGDGLISSGNILVADRDTGWRNIEGNRRNLPLGTTEFTVNQNQLYGPRDHLLVWRWFWLIGHETADPYLAKVILAMNRILGKGGGGAEIMVAASYDRDPEEAASVLREFVTDMKPVITEQLMTVHNAYD